MIWEYLYDISTDYVLGGSRYEPSNTDCSGMVCAGFYQFLGIDPEKLGWWTGGMWQSELTEIICGGTDFYNIPFEVMKEDDIIFTSTESPLFDSVNGSHVGLYTGNPNMPFLSHFCNGGPMITDVNGVYGGREIYYGVRRLKDLSENILHDTSYQEPFPTGADIGTRIVYIDKIVNEIRAMVDRGEIDRAVWEYNFENTAPYGNMYNCLVQTCLLVTDCKRMLEDITDMLTKITDDGR